MNTALLVSRATYKNILEAKKQGRVHNHINKKAEC